LKKIFTYLIFLGISLGGYSQNPGNIGTTNLTGWFKPDGLTIGNVTSWTTTFPTGTNAVTVSDGATPYPQATRTPIGDVSNYNTTIYFNNANSSPTQVLINTSTSGLLENRYTGDQGTLFLAYYLPATTQNDHFIAYNDGQDAIQLRNLGANGRLAIGKGAISTNACRNWTETKKPTVISYKGNRSSSSSMSFYNQSYLWTTSSASSSSGANGLYIGVKPTGGTNLHWNSGLKGYIHEVIFYDTDLSNANMLKVHSYLAIKYGATLFNTGGGTQGDYVSTNGTTIWDASITGAYHNDVIGIGRDDNQGLMQKQSHSFDDITRVYIDTLANYNSANTGTFGSNISYIMVGSNNGTLCSSSASNIEVPAGSGLSERLSREWKVTKTNMTDSISFDIKTANCPSFSNASCLSLLVDDNGVFTNATVYPSGNGLTFKNVGGVITVSGISNLQIPNNSTRYITIGVGAPSIDLGADTVICPGDTIALDATTINATYIWQDNSTSAIYQATVPNKYWVQISSNGCITSDTINITTGPLPSIDLGQDTAICDGDTLSLDATHAGATYLWNDGSTSAMLDIFNAGQYWVQVTNGCGMFRDTFNLNITNYPIVNLGKDTLLCEGDSLGLDATFSGASYAWSDNSIDSILVVTISDLYWVDVTINSCTTRDSINATFNLVPMVDLGNDTAICAGDTLLLDPLNASSSFVWHDGSNDSVFSAFSNGLHWVEVTTLNCSNSDSINISITPYPIPNLGPDVVACDGDDFYVDAYAFGGVYSWNDGSNNYNLNITQSDTYWVDVNVNGCHGYDTVVYLFNEIPVIDLGNDTTICYPDSLTLNASYPGANYLWQNNSTDSLFTVTSQGLYQAEVTSLNCSFTDSIFITVQPKPLADLGNDTIICPNTSFTKGNLVAGANYLWQDGNVNFFYDINSPGEYWVEVSKGSCINSDTIFVDSINLPLVYIGEDTLMCLGDSFTMSSTTPNSVYAWSTGSTDSIEVVGIPGVYWLDVTNICGTVRGEVELSYTTLPEIDLGEDTILCLGDQITLDAYWFNGTNYLWFDGWDSPEYLVYDDGDYLVQVTNLCGAIEDTISVEFRHCECDLFIPNAFTPNGDGIDEDFGPEAFCELKGYHFVVYNRWGQEVFNSNDPSERWDGNLNGEPLQFGLYSYMLRYNFEKRGPKSDYQVKFGTVKLIR
jgi:gliding motility-associated-like protein